MHLRALSALLACALSGCFPQLPDPLVVDDLRVLAIQADPAVATLTTFPPPAVTVRALVVDPDDPEGADIEHHWELELGDEDFEGRSSSRRCCRRGLTRPADIDFAALFEERSEVEWSFSQLPLGYDATLGDLKRESVKLVPLVPQLEVPDAPEPEGIP